MNDVITYRTAAGSCETEILPENCPSAFVLDVAAGWAGTETIPAYYVGKDGVRITPVLDSNGDAFAFSTTNKVLPIYFPCKIRLVKPISVAGMGVNWFAK